MEIIPKLLKIKEFRDNEGKQRILTIKEVSNNCYMLQSWLWGDILLTEFYNDLLQAEDVMINLEKFLLK